MARQAEKAKNENPIITSAEMLKRKDDVVYTCAAIMNRPKPRPKTTDGTSTPNTGGKDDKTGKKPEPETAEPDVEMDTNEEGGPKIEEMDVD